MKSYFPSDVYVTDPDTRRHPLDRLFFRSRWGLYASFAGSVFEARSLAVKGVYDDQRWAESSHRVMRQIESCGGRFRIKGFDNIRNAPTPVVFVGNHMSTLETQVYPALIAPIKPVTFVVKESLVQGPIFGPIMRSRDPITVTRKDPRRDLNEVLTKGTQLLKDGISLIIFPQSTRETVFREDHFNTLGIKLALRAGVHVVPVAIKSDFWENGRLLRGFGPIKRERTIHIEFGGSMAISGRGKGEHAQVVEFIRTRLDDWQVSSSV